MWQTYSYQPQQQPPARYSLGNDRHPIAFRKHTFTHNYYLQDFLIPHHAVHEISWQSFEIIPSHTLYLNTIHIYYEKFWEFMTQQRMLLSLWLIISCITAEIEMGRNMRESTKQYLWHMQNKKKNTYMRAKIEFELFKHFERHHKKGLRYLWVPTTHYNSRIYTNTHRCCIKVFLSEVRAPDCSRHSQD